MEKRFACTQCGDEVFPYIGDDEMPGWCEDCIYRYVMGYLRTLAAWEPITDRLRADAFSDQHIIMLDKKRVTC